MMCAVVFDMAVIDCSIDMVRRGNAGIVEAQILGCALGGDASCRLSETLKRITTGMSCQADSDAIEAELSHRSRFAIAQ
jgi:hypothetical protein